MADNNSKTFISGIVIFAVLVILGFLFFAGKEEAAPVITDEVVVEGAVVEDVESGADASVELDEVLSPETVEPAYVPVEEVPVVEDAPAPAATADTEAEAETIVEDAAQDINDAAADAVEAIEDTAADAVEAVEGAAEDAEVQPAEAGAANE